MAHTDSANDLMAISVGQPYYRWVEMGCQFNYAPSADDAHGMLAPHCELIIGFDNPTEREQQGFQQGVFEAVLVELERIPFVCIRFGQTVSHAGKWVHREAIGWQECPVHPVAAMGYVPPAPPAPHRWLLSLALVDSETQVVKGIRAVSLSPEFCQHVSQTLQAHRDEFSSPTTYAAKLRDLYDRYPVGGVVAKGQVLAHCLGGD